MPSSARLCEKIRGRVSEKVLGLVGGRGMLGAGEHPTCGEPHGIDAVSFSRRALVQLCGSDVLVVSMDHFLSDFPTDSSSSKYNCPGRIFIENDRCRC